MKPHPHAPQRTAISGTMDARRAMCLLAILLGACSVDVGKLRALALQYCDGAVDLSLALDTPPAGAADGGAGTGMDGRAIPGDVLGSDDGTAPWDGRAPSVRDALDDVAAPVDGAGAYDAPGSGGDVGDAPRDGDRGEAQGSDVALGDGGAGGLDAAGTGGSGGTSTVDANEDGRVTIDGASDGPAGAGAPDAGQDGPSDVAGTGGMGGTDPDLVLWYRFDEGSGTVASDSSPLGSHDGTVDTTGFGASATFSTDCQVGTHALSLAPSSFSPSSSGGYVTVPAPEPLAPDAMTVAIWVRLSAATSTQNWERIYDFSSGSTSKAFFYMTARASDATNVPVRFGISNMGHTAASEQRLEGTSMLSANEWHHLVVVLPAGTSYTGTLYIDGRAVATNDAMTLHLSDIATTTQNWLGRSPFTGDPYFNGSLDDFRIYKRALSPAEVSALYAFR